MTTEGFLEAAGVRTLVRTSGSGGTPLILLHGVLSEGATWEGVAGHLAQGRMVVCPDLPLHGRTETPPAFRPNPEGLVKWLEALMDALGIDMADLLGLSLGGAVALHFALARPDRLRRMVLVDAANVVDLDEGFLGFISEMRQNLEAASDTGMTTGSQGGIEGMGVEGARTAAANMCADPIIMSVLDYLEQRGIPLDQVMHGLRFLDPIEPGGFADVQAPTLAIWGSDDPFFSADRAVPLLETIPDVSIEVMEGVGHNPAHERPERFVELVGTFLGDDFLAKANQRQRNK
jgi:pimeloyl-ACP methyl ester carboxylesterase